MEQINEAVETRSGGARLKKGGGAGGPVLLALGLTALIAGGAYLGLCAYAQNSGTIWKNTVVLNQDIGGLTREEAIQKVEAAAADLSIDLILYDGDAASDAPENGGAGVDPGQGARIPLSGLGARVDAAALVDFADQAERSQPFLTAAVRYLDRGEAHIFSKPDAITLDPEKTAGTARRVAGELSWPALDTEYTVEENALLVRVPKDGRAVDAEDLEVALLGRAWMADLAIPFPCRTLSPAKTMTAQDIHNAVSGEVKNAGYDPETDTITPEQMGADFDVSAAQTAMDAAEPGSTVRIGADIQLPDVTAEELEAVLFRDVLGEARTHVGGTAARISNVKLAAAAFNGTVLNSGDVFSYNETVGQRTAAKGYKPAPAYIRGETVDEIGGGVCQPSSTLYLACLRANLEITERYAHRYVPSYIGKGLDATVSWGGPDYKFTNNTDYPIKLAASMDSKNNLTVQILGTKTDDITVKMTYEQLSSTPYETVYEDDPTLPAGTETVKTTPYTGYRVRSYRNLYDGQGKLISSSFEAASDYKARNKVILRGPADPAAGPIIDLPADTPGGTPGGPSGDTPIDAPVDTPDTPIIPAETDPGQAGAIDPPPADSGAGEVLPPQQSSEDPVYIILPPS